MFRVKKASRAFSRFRKVLSWQKGEKRDKTLVLILDGNSELCAQVRRTLCYGSFFGIRGIRLDRKLWQIGKFFSEKTFFPSKVRIISEVTIWYEVPWIKPWQARSNSGDSIITQSYRITLFHAWMCSYTMRIKTNLVFRENEWGCTSEIDIFRGKVWCLTSSLQWY